MRSLAPALGLALGLLIAALGAAPPAPAGDLLPPPEIYQVLCAPEIDLIEVRRLDVAPETAREVVARRDEKLAAANNLYVPDWHAHLDRDSNDPGYGIEPTTFKCPLGIGPAELVLLPEPIEGLGNSLAVTLKIKGKLIVDDVPFRLCAHGGPITGLTYSGYTERIMLDGRFGVDWTNLKELSDVFNAVSVWYYFNPKNGAPGGNRLKAGLRPRDVPYNGISDNAREHATAEACRYDGPGSPKRRVKNR